MQVLIVGAGPTGLTLALWLARLGVKLRIVDKAAGPGETSRALAVMSRTLEFHRQIGVVDEVLAAGLKINRLAIRTPEGVAATLDFSAYGAGLSRYAFAFALPQDIHERILIAQLERDGVTIERGTELVGLEQSPTGVTARLQRHGATESIEAAYLVGCDGARSAVRNGLNLGFAGGTYDQSFYVADVVGQGLVAQGGMDVCLTDYGFGVILPVRQSGSIRLIGVVPTAHQGTENIRFEDIRAEIERVTGVTIRELNWFSTYRVHHRVADKFRVGRVFIAGDAGHIHSPAGGQGMNTGIGDAVNLAWKLAAVLQGRADELLLDSYEPERIAFAHLLIRTTDQAFRFVTSSSRFSGLFRRYVMPRVLSLVVRTRIGGRALFKLVSQTRIHYRMSPISSGDAGKVRGGDRLPYVATAAGDNFAPLGALDWQVHVYGTVSDGLRTALQPSGIEIVGFAWSTEAETTGLVRDAAYLVRPDGYVALAMPDQNSGPLLDYLDRLKVKPLVPARDRPAVEGAPSEREPSQIR